jgi:HSP20 family protein
MATRSGKSPTRRPAKSTIKKSNSKPVTKAAAKSNRAAASTNDSARNPLLALRHEIDRLFEDLTSGLPAFPAWRRGLDVEPFKRRQASLWSTMPAVDLIDKPREYRLTAELPGLDEKDIELTVSEDVLTIKGEKRDERKEKKKDFFLSERRYGAFQRSFRLPTEVTAEKIDARFQRGVLTITLPKNRDGKKTDRKIAVKRG